MLDWVAQAGSLRTVRQFGASGLQKAFERKWERGLLLIMLKTYAVEVCQLTKAIGAMARLAQLVEQATLHPGVMGSSL